MRYRGLVNGLRASFRLRSHGRPHIENDGLIEIGAGCRLGSHPVRSHLVVMRGATLKLGSDVMIAYGAGISAKTSITIGDGTRIGPFCLILDNDFHSVSDLDSPGGAAPIEIGRDVRIGSRVTVLRGARIGDGVRILSGSTVAGVIPAGWEVAGVPARAVAEDLLRTTRRTVSGVVMRVFGMPKLPSMADGPAQIAGWKDVGVARLMLALEETFKKALPADSLYGARSVAELADIVTQAR